MLHWFVVAGLISTSWIFSARAALVFDFGSVWKYKIGTEEASSPDPGAWRVAGFDDSGWLSGRAPIGYAAPANTPAEESLVTHLPTSQQQGYTSVFLRQEFNVQSPTQIRELTLNFTVDDGCVVWINGLEVTRFNVPSGDLAFNAVASSAGEAASRSMAITQNLSQLLVPGENVLAVHLFNGNLTSSDLVFDAALSGDFDNAPPVILEILPPANSVVGELIFLEVVFDESVSGVDAADLLINGLPAESLVQVSPRQYAFGFPQPPAGRVDVAWIPGHGITDLAPAPNPFAGGSWSYTLDLSQPSPSVVISEFLAENDNGIRDDDGNRSDWIELVNSGSLGVNLEGWFLTDTTSNLAQWRFPAVTIEANGYLLVWASAKDRTNPSAPLHTNFKLDKDGGYLALVDPQTNIVSAFAPGYPPQRADVSYGRDLLDPSLTGYLHTPTPGAANTISGPGFAPEPVFSLDSGVFTNSSITVALSAPSGQIRFTLDGSVPTTNSALYANPVTISSSTALKARVFQSPLLPSAVGARTYFLVDNSVAGFRSKLPIVVISTGGRAIAQDVRPGQLRTFASLLATDTFRGRSSPLGAPDYMGLCELEIRGQTSAGFPKKPYNLELQDARRNNLNAPLLGLPSGSDWVLNNPYSDKPFLQNFLAFELHEMMGHYAVRRRFVEVFVNTAGGKITYPRDYAGIYLLLEKIRADDDRVDIARLTTYDQAEPDITGGYIFKKDKDSAGDRNFSTSGGAGFPGQNLKIHEPKPRDITTPQLNWLRGHLNQFERALYAANWRTATGTNHYSWYIDVDSFVDYHWIVEYAKQIDGYRLSNYLHKDRAGKIKMSPIWDWNLSFGNADYLEGWRTNGWYYSLISADQHIWLRRLIKGTTSASGTSGDPDFNQRIADRWSVLRTHILSTPRVLDRVDELAALLDESAARDFQKWPRLGNYIWPNPSFYVTPRTYQGIIDAMKNWIRGRYNWIDSQFLGAPQFHPAGGRIPPGFQLSISNVSGTLYYTLDGTDPRLPGGAVSPAAQFYSAPIPLPANARVFARARTSTQWSGPALGTFVVETPPLRLTELMFHPAAPPDGSLYSSDDFEFIEFENAGTRTLNLEGFKISGGIDFQFPNWTLEPGHRVLAVKNRTAFEARYGTGLPVAGEFARALDNSGERLELRGPLEEPVLSFSYRDDWYRVTDGLGFSLVPAASTGGTVDWADPSNWRPSAAPNGSPGQPEGPAPAFPQVVVNEVLTRPAPPGAEWIELQNLSPVPASIGGWFLTDAFDQPQKFRIPDGTSIAPGGFIVFTALDFSASPSAAVPFSLSGSGEEIYLFSGDARGNLTGYSHGFRFGAQQIGVTFGRYLSRDGTEQFVSQSRATRLEANSGPQISPVVITEIMYHPPDVFANGAWWNNSEHEYIELFNRTDQPVALSSASSQWQIQGEIKYAFPDPTIVPARSFLVLVRFDPAQDPARLNEFRSRYGSDATLLGPYRGSLGNGGGTLRLFFSVAPASPDNVSAAPIYVVADQLDYDDNPPWPPGADGLGFALTRIDPETFGNDAANWVAATPTPGLAFSPAPYPEILEQPQDQTAVASQTVTLSVSAGSGALGYQWRRDGQNLAGATNATLTLSPARAEHSGEYRVVVFGQANAVVSSPAHVIVEPDWDGDGVPDEWELAYGLNPYDPADGTSDPDGDGSSNRDEYLAGTDPRSVEPLRIDGLTAAGPVTLWFRAAANRSYTIEYSASLNPAVWIPLTRVNAQSTNFTAVVTDLTTASSRYYRIVTGQ